MRSILLFLFALIAITKASSISRSHIEPFTNEHVEYINGLKTTWKAAANFPGYKLEDVKGLCGTILKNNNDAYSGFFESDVSDLPENFDSREHWPKCSDVISHIRDQGSCGSCWAVATASEITDRICIATAGKNKTQISAQNLASCCEDCAPDGGCQGGYPASALEFWTSSGLPSGGDYGDKTTCAPYLIPPCEHHVNGSRPQCGEIVETPKCNKKCTNDQIDLENDLNYGSSYVSLSPDPNEIKEEISSRGPVTASFMVYDDFPLYKEGIYQVTPGAKFIGGHAVVVIGWGKDKDTGIKYWLAKNNWNTDWGENGYFKIKFGEAQFDSEMMGAITA